MPVTPATLAGVWVPWVVTFRAARAGGPRHSFLVSRPDTISLTVEGEWRTHGGAAPFFIRHDSLFVQYPAEQRAYAVSLRPTELGLYAWSAYDLNADGLLETGIRRVGYYRVGSHRAPN